MDLNLLNNFLFHPRTAFGQLTEKDKLIELEPGVQVGIRIHIVDPVYPLILFFHGNGEIAPEYDDIAAVYNQRKINFIIADYRGYGFSTGAPDVQNTLTDAHVVLDTVLSELKMRGVSGPLILMGRSLGSVSVLELSGRYPKDFDGLIIESGISTEEPLFRLIGTTAEQAGYKKDMGFQNDEKIKNYKGPLLIIHAEQDHIVPFSQGEELLNLCPSENKKLVPIPNAHHNNILGVSFQKYFEEVEKFISKNSSCP